MQQKTIGVVGLGRMGANMARRMKDCGHEVGTVFDVVPELAGEMAEELGAQAAGSLAEVTAAADVVVTVVTDDKAMRAIFAPDQLLAGAQGKVFINCATVSPEVHEEIGAACAAAGARSLEACMASSITQARDGTLYLMVAGDEATFREVEPLLKDLSKSLRYIGPTGSAAKVKALVNMVMNINTAGLAEGLGLGVALGLDPEMLKEVFSQTGANSRVLETDGDDMIAREHDCYFSAAHAAKDSGIANSLADKVGVGVPLSKATQEQYQKLVSMGRGELDKSAVAELTFPGRSND
ncbi:3-hydroxyisobutyrate dehydrogenase-like beta-hydroxyacid dehydrogenase [Haloferula luteola]|uniref:3-hydroxyisobutyrate dehydrogenase-like beta-hydroxyacid dehydrogenase n=1 Tax=Haloferula luteola TaxID=595692 RepID=A0A840VFA0_9BACT|nr:NAD(P)-dependent oxidoreductase [Haloferula luteola]MBB5351481.1 3-hydroxyisobutyrate dehydrogenase-like beta-hydroxyacid dehydrogenase [Haloferula luteola]